MPNPDPNIVALLKLLADDHPPVVEAARAKLIEFGEQVVPLLEETARGHEDPKVRVEAKGILEKIRLVGVNKEWEKAAQLPDDQIDLEKGVFLLAKVCYPEVDLKLYQHQLDDLADKIRPKLKSGALPKNQLAILNRFLFRDERFRGNWVDYFDPQNSYLNRVLDRKLGIPISLSVLYLLISHRLNLDVQGAGIPGHFMVKYKDSKDEFFVDVFNEGRFLSRPECVQFMVEAGYPYQVDFLDGIGPRAILARMLRNLILIYVERQEETLEKALTQFLEALYPAGGPEDFSEGVVE